MKAKISSIGAFVPEKVVTNDDLSKTLDTTDEWIYSHTGIRERHIVEKAVPTSELGTKAAELALKRAGMDAKEIDMIIVPTATPDYGAFPAAACIIQERIGAVNAGAFDLFAACTGFIYALGIGESFIASGTYKNILVIGAEVFSTITDWSDRSTCILFGDGAGAVVMTPADDTSGILGFSLKAEGSGADALLRPKGGSADPFVEGEVVDDRTFIKMDGKRVYDFAVRACKETIEELAEKNSLNIERDIKYIVPHQANGRIIQSVAKRLKVPYEKFYVNVDRYANTSSASIPIALNEMEEKKLLQKGDKLILVGFGSGLTYGGCVINW